jgi:simple sugar transport system permease protein
MSDKTVAAAPQRSPGKGVLDAFMASNGALSALVVLVGFACGTAIIVAVGRDPAGLYLALLQTLTGFNATTGIWNARYIGEWLTASMPLILCGMSMGFAARTGLFNIGAEGQYIAGLTAAQFVALFAPHVPGLHWLAALLVAGFVGAAWGGIVGWLRARYAVSEVVATIMLNYIAYFLSRYLTRLLPDANTYRTPTFPTTALIPRFFLDEMTNHSRLSVGIFAVLLCVLLYWLVLERTKLGFELRATGLNRHAARYAGISVNRSFTISMAIAGGFAGLAGAVVALGSFSYGRVLGGYDNYGFNGIAVALVGNSTAAGTLVSGLLFGMLSSAQPLMQSRQIPKEIAWIISGLVVVLISLRAGFRMLVEWRAKLAAERGREAQGARDE